MDMSQVEPRGGGSCWAGGGVEELPGRQWELQSAAAAAAAAGERRG